MLYKLHLKLTASNDSINLKSVTLDLTPAKTWYSSNTEDRHQFCNFRKHPTRQPVLCCSRGETEAAVSNKKVLQTCRSFLLKRIWSAFQLNMNQSMRHQWFHDNKIPPSRYDQRKTGRIKTQGYGSLLPSRVCSGWELDGSSHLKRHDGKIKDQKMFLHGMLQIIKWNQT